MKSPIRPLIPFIIAALAGACPAAPGNPRNVPEKGPLMNWIGAKPNQVARARFISIGDDVVILELANGEQKSVQFSWFSRQSLEQAHQEAAKQADQTIAKLREGFRKIGKGGFTMGSPITEKGRDKRQLVKQERYQPPTVVAEPEPEHKVTIGADFWLKQTEVTWAEWNAVRNWALDNGFTDLAAGRKGSDDDDTDDHPVTDISWWDAVKWCNAKSRIEDKTPAYYTSPAFNKSDVLITGTPPLHVKWDASGYRLPTEAEWEYACREKRNNNPPAFHSGSITHPGVSPPDESLDEVAWYAGNSSGTGEKPTGDATRTSMDFMAAGTHPVKGKAPNRLDLYDMHGNVAEWCWDWAGFIPMPLEDTKDPRGADDGTFRIYRGGSWADPAACCRAAYRATLSPMAPSSCLVGFRPACGSDPQKPDSPEPELPSAKRPARK